jgi:hypothetical protein
MSWVGRKHSAGTEILRHHHEYTARDKEKHETKSTYGWNVAVDVGVGLGSRAASGPGDAKSNMVGICVVPVRAIIKSKS